MSLTLPRTALVLALLPLAAAAQTVIINDTFSDNDRLNSNLPGSAAWYSSSTSVSHANVVDAGGGNLALEISGSTTARQVATFFTPISLAVDDKLTVSFDFTPTATIPATDSVLRIGLVNGATPQTGDSQIAGVMSGYAVWVNSGTNLARFRERTENSGGIVNSAPAWATRGDVGDQTPDPTFAWVQNETYAISFSIQRVSETEINLVYNITGNGVDFTTSFLDDSITAIEFNALAFGLHNTLDTGLIDNVLLEVAVIPEPANLTVWAGALALGWFAFIRRRNRQ